MEARKYGLTRARCFVAGRLDVVAVAGLLWIWWYVVGGVDFFVFFVFFFDFVFHSNAQGLLPSMRPPCLIYLSTSTWYRYVGYPEAFYRRNGIDKCRIPRPMWSPDRKPECSPSVEDSLSTRDGLFGLILRPPCPPASTAPGDGMHCGLLKGSCGRRHRRAVSKRQNLCEPPKVPNTYFSYRHSP